VIAALLLGLAPLLSPAAAPRAPAPDGVHERARELIEGREWQAAVELLREHLKGAAQDALANELIGRALLALGRRDEAAHHLATAVASIESGGDPRAARFARRDLARADPFNSRRERFFRDVASKLYKAAEALHESGHPERALDLLERIEPIARGKGADEVRALRAKVRAAFEQIDLDEAGVERSEEGFWPLVELESEHYRLRCNLEPEVVELVADTMDDLHAYYVQLYFDGDEKAARGARATIRVHPDKRSMLGEWQGAGAGPEGWWSPGENQVTCYDTRTSTGSLDWMLTTLFHEASHQFMSLLARKGGWAPSWLNEGTATFFEGAVAMADHRVLWPDAALERLQNLALMLKAGGGPAASEVVGYSGGGSYPPEYYPFGWGLVYFMQQYEDPGTLVYAYRPLYARYREEITTKGGDSMRLFERTFLGPGSPLGHATFDDFAADWKAWILDEVEPLHLAPPRERRALRSARIERYARAAGVAAGDRKAPVAEDDLLRRALGHVEYVRTRIDGEESPDLELFLLQADLLERLGRPAGAAPLVQRVLDLADEGVLALDQERYAMLEERLKRLDRRNWALRNARSRVRGLTRAARILVEDYQAGDEPLILRAYTFAAAAGRALDDQEVLLPAAGRLRDRARAAGLLLGQVRPFATRAGDWTTIFSSPALSLRCSRERIEIKSVRPSAYVDTSFEVGPEYELRARVRRAGEVFMSSAHGLVIAAAREGDWLAFGFGRGGHAGLWRFSPTPGGAISRSVETLFLDPPLADGEQPELVVHVAADRTVEIRIEGREPIRTALPEDLGRPRHVGVFVKDGECVLERPAIEIFP